MYFFYLLSEIKYMKGRYTIYAYWRNKTYKIYGYFLP